MTGLFFLLAMLALLVTSVCGIWLLVLSFQESALWGLAVLFIPFAVVVFAIRYWDVAKKPFIGHLGGSVAAALFMIVGVASGVSGAVAEANQAMNEAAAPSFEVSDTSSVPTVSTPEPTPRRRSRPRPERVTPRPRLTSQAARLSFANANDFIGSLIKVTSPDGRVLKGYLIDAGTNKLVLERDLSSGVFTFELTRNEVQSMEVIR